MSEGKSISLPHPRCGVNLLLWRLVVTTVTLWPLMVIYMIINHHQPATPAVVTMPSWVPFWPVFALPYLGMLLATWLLPVAIGDPARFRACLIAMVCAHLAVMPWWIISPTTLLRPPLPMEWWAGSYRWIAAHDLPNNIMPCAHGIGPLMAAWFVGRERLAWRWPMAAMLLVGLSSIFLVWQHRPVDVALGMLVAIIGIVVSERDLMDLPRRQQWP